MVKILNMQFIRYANLFSKITNIRTNHCFEYNHMILFAVPRKFVLTAIGKNNSNLKELNRLIGKKIKIVAIPQGKEDIEHFVSVIVHPIKFREIELKEDTITIRATTQNRASLIGRDKIRLKEMENILEQYFEIKKLRIK